MHEKFPAPRARQLTAGRQSPVKPNEAQKPLGFGTYNLPVYESFKSYRSEWTLRTSDGEVVNALIKRLRAESVVFDFAVQVRDRTKLLVETDIENAPTEWPDDFVNVARITIPMQEFDSPEQRVLCEELFFTPWHGIADHLPIGGINRLRKAVYLESSKFRNLPKEPSSSH